MAAVLRIGGRFLTLGEKRQVSESYVAGPHYSAEYQHVERLLFLPGTVQRHVKSTDCHGEPSFVSDRVLS